MEIKIYTFRSGCLLRVVLVKDLPESDRKLIALLISMVPLTSWTYKVAGKHPGARRKDVNEAVAFSFRGQREDLMELGESLKPFASSFTMAGTDELPGYWLIGKREEEPCR